MAVFAEKIIAAIEKTPGLTDRELTDELKGRSAHQQHANLEARRLAEKGVLKRTPRHDGKIGNYLTGVTLPAFPAALKSVARSNVKTPELLSEDILKKHLQVWLEGRGWETEIAWGKKPGVDILAKKENLVWAIEVKGIGSRDAMRVNYFLAILGETLQRMKDKDAKYFIALPDIQQYRNLWSRLPALAKERTRINILLVDHTGHVTEDFV